jgi:hypothetical protein
MSKMLVGNFVGFQGHFELWYARKGSLLTQTHLLISLHTYRLYIFQPANFIQEIAMFFTPTKLLRPRREVCDCCKHGNINIALLLDDDEVAERKKMKKRLRNIFASLRWERLKETCKRRKASARKAIKKHFRTIHKRVRRIGRKRRTFEVRRKKALQTTQAATDSNEQVGKHPLPYLLKLNNTDLSDPLRSAVRNLLTTMFKDIVESDLSIAKQTHSTTQCFLVHLLNDLDPNGSFLSSYAQPPSSAFNMDLNLALTFVSGYLQGSLTTIKAVYPEGCDGLQMPFCVLETTQAGANTRAQALQRRYPEGEVGIAILDFAALQREKLVVSAAHAFDFLRVSRTDFWCGRKLLAWAEGDGEELSAKAFRNAVLRVHEWKDMGVATDSESMEEELEVAAETPLPEDEDEKQWAKWMDAAEKLDSGVVSRAASKESKGVQVTTSEIGLTRPRFLSL